MEKLEYIKGLYKEAIELEFSNPHESYRISKKAYDLADKLGDMKNKADGLYYMSCACRVMSDYSECLRRALSALELYESMADQNGIVNTNMMVGIIYFYSGDFSSALEYFMSAESAIDETVGKHRAIATASNIGEVYKEAGNYDKALERYNSGLQIAKEHGYEDKVSYVYNNISEVYMAQAKYDLAYDTCLKALEKMSNAEDNVSTVNTEYLFGKLLMLRGDYKRAEDYYNRSLKRLKKMNNKFYMIELLINMSELATLEGKNSLDYLLEALDVAKQIESNSKLSRVYKLLSSHYEDKEDFKTAMMYYKNYHMMEKEIEADNLSQRLALLLVEIDYSKEKNEHEQLKAFSEKLNRDRNTAIDELDKIRRENIHLQKLNTIDELTQVLNKRGIYNELEKVLDYEDKPKSALFIVDIDHFKKYNDTWGHIQGDETLKMVAKALTNIPTSDFTVGRFGGEEFVCHAFVENEEEAISIAQNINESIEYLQIQMDKVKRESYLTVSIGGVIGEVTYDRVSHWLDIADKELYVAKDAGRNRYALTEVFKE